MMQLEVSRNWLSKDAQSVILYFDPLLHMCFIPSLEDISKDWHLQM
uniref:Uncharacterized protein n=1 Tax=Arundo donax TaxID=35708 RepID=A0A0A9FPQ1_ARUDO